RCCSKCQTSEPLSEADLGELLDDYLHVFPADARPSKLALMSEWITLYGQSGRLMKYTSPGCGACGGSGYKGCAGLHELLTVSKNLRRLIQT
ncbi:hypothetical protein ABTL08_19295, partial [Acinetobacter baumannii]